MELLTAQVVKKILKCSLPLVYKMAGNQTNPLNEILTEKELLDLLGIKKDFLSRLRLEKKFPFCKISETQRVYLARDVVDYIRSKRMVINRNA